jgi:hypothetical protein
MLCADSHYAKCHYANNHYAERHFEKCLHIECRGAIFIAKVSDFFILFSTKTFFFFISRFD